MMILSCYTSAQVGKNPQLPVASLLKVGHYIDDVTRGTISYFTYCIIRILPYS